MSLLRNRRPRPVERPWMKVSCGDEFPVEVHGESFHEPMLRALSDQAGAEIDGDRLRATFPVSLCREPDNTYDVNAVAVRSMSGEPLGYLPRELAGEYSAVLEVPEQRYQTCCDARAFGRLNGGEWNIGLWLALPDADQLAALIAEISNDDVSPHAPGDVLARRGSGAPTENRTLSPPGTCWEP
jgi:hypothetical protein